MRDIIPLAWILDTIKYDYFMLFEVKNNQYNEIPNLSNSNHFIYLAYNKEKGILQIYEFEKSYE